MQDRINYSVTTAGVVVCFFLVGLSCRGPAIASQQESQERTLEVQLKELSSLVSKSSDIQQDFERHVSSDGSIIVVSNNPEKFIHVFGLTNSKEFLFEMRELKDVKFVVGYQPSDAPGVRIPNPINDANRYALIAFRKVSMMFPPTHPAGPKPLADLTDLAPLAEQPLTPKGYLPAYNSKLEWASYTGLTLMIVDRLALRDDQGILRAERFPTMQQLKMSEAFLQSLPGQNGYVYQSCVHISESRDYPTAWILYKPCASLAPFLARRFTREELLRRVYRWPLVHHDFTSTYRGRVRAINRLLRGRKFIDLMLSYQQLSLQDGIWKADTQSYASGQDGIGFERINNKMVITVQ